LWVELFTQTVWVGGREIEMHRELDAIPALLGEGGILPLAAEAERDATRTPERLELLVAPGADGAFTLVEDDGTGTGPEDIATVVTLTPWRGAGGELRIGAAEGAAGVLPRERTWTVTVLGTGRSETVSGP